MSSLSPASPEQSIPSAPRLKDRLAPSRFFRSPRRPSPFTPSPGPSTPKSVGPTPNAVSGIQQGKQTVQAVRTAADPVLSTLGWMVTKLLDISELMEENNEECRALAEKLTRADGLLHRADGVKVDGEWVVQLRSAVSETNTWLASESQRTTVRRIANSPQSQRDIARLNTTLETALGHARDFFLADAWDRSRTQAPGSAIAQVPSDLPMVQLPPPPQIFFGRDGLVNSLVDALLAGEQTCRIPILGPGGIGKTSVASAVLNNERIETKYGRHRIFVSCEGATSAQDIVNTLATALDVSSQADPTNALIGYLTSRHSAILLVLDNLETAWDSADQVAVGQLLARFCGVKRLSLIITMRGEARPTQVKWTTSLICHLATLDNESARQIFIDITGKEEEGMEELLKLLEGLPLAITLMAYQGQSFTPKALLAAYRAERTYLLNAGADDRLSSLDVSIRLSLNCFTMRKHPQAHQLLSLISVLPDGISTADLAGLVPSMTNRSEAARILIRVGLATQVGHVLRVLAPIRDFMLQHFAPHGPYLTDLQRYFIQMASREYEMGSPSGLAAMKVLTPQFGNIHAVLMYTWATWPSVSPELRLGRATLNLATFSYLYSYGDCTVLLERSIGALKAPDVPCESVATLSTALGYPGKHPAGEDEEAVIHPQVEMGSPSDGQWLLQAQVMRRLGLLYVTRCRYDDAVHQLTEAWTVFDEIGDRHGATQCLQGLGNISRMQHQYDDAVSQLTEARAAFDEIGDRLGAAQCLHGLGDISRMQTRYDDAVRQLTDAQATFDEIGNRGGATQCLQGLGDISRMQARYDDAERQLTNAQAAFDEIGDRLGAAQCLQALGDISRMQARYDDAVRQSTEARATFDEIGDRLGTAQCLRGLGDTFRMQARYDDAVRHLTDAQATFEEIGNRLGAAQCLQRLGILSYSQDRLDDAVHQLTDAQTIFQAFGSNTLGIAECNEHLGYTLINQGKAIAAREHLRLAHQLYTNLEHPTDVEICQRELEKLAAGLMMTSDD